MLLHFAGTAATAHTDVLDGTAKARRFMALEMCQADKDIGIHDGPADFRHPDILSAAHGYLYVIRTLEAIGNNHLTARRYGIEAVEIRAIQMLQRVLAATRIQRVAIREKGTASLLLADIGDTLRILRTQIREVA